MVELGCPPVSGEPPPAATPVDVGWSSLRRSIVASLGANALAALAADDVAVVARLLQAIVAVATTPGVDVAAHRAVPTEE